MVMTLHSNKIPVTLYKVYFGELVPVENMVGQNVILLLAIE